MTGFYRIGNNTLAVRGMPWIQTIVSGLTNVGGCRKCGSSGGEPAGDLEVLLEPKSASHWPDVMGCGHYPCFVISKRFLDAMQHDGIRLELGGTVEILNPIAAGLPRHDSPRYFWIDGRRHRAGKMDFDASGFVGVYFCTECGTRHDNVRLTNERLRSAPPPPTVFAYDESLGFDLFTTDLSPTAFFCTDRVLGCASHNKLTNLRFHRVEEGDHGEPIAY